MTTTEDIRTVAEATGPAAFVRQPPAIWSADLLEAIAGQATQADRTRNVDPDVIARIKASEVLALSATRTIGGHEASMVQLGAELGAIAAACSSTAWCLWNHLCVFHLFCGALGPAHRDLLAGIVERHEWVCFPAGAGSRVLGRVEGDVVRLSGPAGFGSGCRYADWAGVAFALTDGTSPVTAADLRFSIVRLDSPGVRIEPTWDAASLRATATDTVHYDDVVIPLERCVPWYAANRAEILRDPDLPMISHRYREDWVGLSDLWLGSMAIGVVTAALTEAVASIGGGRRAIMGASMAQMPMVQANLGEVASLLAAARSMIERATAEVDERITFDVFPTEFDYRRQASVPAIALQLCEQAMQLLLRTQGGNGLRESGTFERRWRDFTAMPLHINAHPDRVHPRLGQLLLGVDPDIF